MSETFNARNAPDRTAVKRALRNHEIRAVQPDEQGGLPHGGFLLHDGVCPGDGGRVLARGGLPSTAARPPVGAASPASSRSSVVLPTP
jgi:hypothetical protein